MNRAPQYHITNLIGWFLAAAPLVLFLALALASIEVRLVYGEWPESEVGPYPSPFKDWLFALPIPFPVTAFVAFVWPVTLAFIWSFEKGRPALIKTIILIIGLLFWLSLFWVPAKYIPIYLHP